MSLKTTSVFINIYSVVNNQEFNFSKSFYPFKMLKRNQPPLYKMQLILKVKQILCLFTRVSDA